MNDLFQCYTGHELKNNEEYKTYYNKYNELCYIIYNVSTNEIIKQSTF